MAENLAQPGLSGNGVAVVESGVDRVPKSAIALPIGERILI
jgi:hypothetical protein